MTDPYKDDPFPDIPSWPRKPGGGGDEGEGNGGGDEGKMPLDVNFYFFLFWSVHLMARLGYRADISGIMGVFCSTSFYVKDKGKADITGCT